MMLVRICGALIVFFALMGTGLIGVTGGEPSPGMAGLGLLGLVVFVLGRNST